MLGFQCDCSVDCDECLAAWDEGWLVATSRPAVWCCECGRWIRPGERYWQGSGIHPDEIEDSEYYEDHDYEEVSERDELKREEFDTCLGCRRIAERFCSGGYYLGQLAEAVSECLGYYYTEDPDEWDQEEVDEEDAENRESVLSRRSSGSVTMHHQRPSA